jgi:hypothetical protein
MFSNLLTFESTDLIGLVSIEGADDNDPKLLELLADTNGWESKLLLDPKLFLYQLPTRSFCDPKLDLLNVDLEGVTLLPPLK